MMDSLEDKKKRMMMGIQGGQQGNPMDIMMQNMQQKPPMQDPNQGGFGGKQNSLLNLEEIMGAKGGQQDPNQIV